MDRRTVLRTLLAGLLSGPAMRAYAETAYPNRLITIVVPFPAGGVADMLSRLVGEHIKQTMGQTVLVENKTGASGNIGTEAVYRSPPNGYVMLTAPQLTFSVNNLLHPNLRFDPSKLEPVSVLATYPFVLFARADLPVNTMPELIAYARANPGKLTYASQGRGQMGHLALEAIKLRENVDIVHVPYRGTIPAMTDLISGQVDLLADSMLAGLQHVRSGKLKLIAVGGKNRLPAFPDIATFAETLPGFYCETWMAIAAPPRTPKDITEKLSTGIAEALRTPAAQQMIKTQQADPFGSTPDEMKAMIKESYETWAPVITKLGITSD